MPNDPHARDPNEDDRAEEPMEDIEDPLAAAEGELARLQAEGDELRNKYLYLMADFQNYQRRSLQNERVAREGGIASAIASVLPVVDHFDLALGLSADQASAEQIIQGVRVIREELIKAIQQSGVRVISPAPNDEFTPGTHEAIMQQPAEGVQSGRVAATFQPGFAIGERVIRPAKVSVAP